MFKTKEIVAIFGLFIIMGIIVYPKVKNVTPSQNIPFDSTLREVSFCGNKYKTRDVAIDGINIVQRISEIASEKYYKEFSTTLDFKKIPNYFNNAGLNICANILSAKNTYGSNPQDPSVRTLEINNNENLLRGTKIIKTGETIYSIKIESGLYSITIPDNTIELMNGYDGSYIFLGKLK